MQLDTHTLAAAALRLQALERAEAFDGTSPGTRPNPFQLQVIEDWGKVPTQAVVAGNQSGKTALGARISAWFLAENKADWTRPAKWGQTSLVGLIVGRTMKQVEEEILRKVQAFFSPDELHIPKVGMIPQKIVHRKTGNTLLLASHHNESEAREKLQAFVLNFVWLDEMPKSSKLFEELERRVQTKDGFFLSTFTPKVRNRDIQTLVDSYTLPYSRKYQMPMFANPALSEQRKVKILQELEVYPEAYRKCVLEGGWLTEDTAVYQVPDSCIQAPANYQPTWRHVEGADPALQSKHGQVVLAEDPRTNAWYVVKADYVSGIAVPEDLIRTVTERLKGLNIVRRVCDSASTWYIGQAFKMGFTYDTPWDKNNRRAEFMKNMQAALGKTLFIAPWCTDLINELSSMQWSETADSKVVNSHSYHLHDALIYSVDCLPRAIPGTEPVPPLHVRLRLQLEKDRSAAAAKAKQPPTTNRLLAPMRIGQGGRRRSWKR